MCIVVICIKISRDHVTITTLLCLVKVLHDVMFHWSSVVVAPLSTAGVEGESGMGRKYIGGGEGNEEEGEL